MLNIIRGLIIYALVSLTISGCNQNFVTVKLPSLEKPIYAQHEKDPIAKNAVIPDKRYRYRPIKLSETNKGEPVVDGEILFDSHGKILEISQQSDTGYVSYIVENPEGGHDLNYFDPIKGSEPKKFGSIYRADSGQNYYLHEATGNKYAFSGYYLGSHGILLARNKHTFIHFSPNTQSEPKVIRLPEKDKFEYKLSDYQRGDFSYTRHLLVKRFVDNSRLLGLKSDNEYLYDYSWFNIDTGMITTVFPIYIDGRSGKTVDDYAYNLMFLFATNEGPICITREKEAFKNVYARNLWTGQKELLFTRDHGIHSMNAELMSSKKIKVIAGMGFENHEIDDVVGYMNKNANVLVKKK